MTNTENADFISACPCSDPTCKGQPIFAPITPTQGSRVRSTFDQALGTVVDVDTHGYLQVRWDGEVGPLAYISRGAVTLALPPLPEWDRSPGGH